nr:hypothetical protein [Streptomyces sp. NBC_01460]
MGVTVGCSQVTIELTADEALVLSHWLEKLQMTDLSRVVDDPAVWAPIHRIAGTLDKALPEQFARDDDAARGGSSAVAAGGLTDRCDLLIPKRTSVRLLARQNRATEA